MTINELITKLQSLSYGERVNVDAVVRCLDAEFDIDAVGIESFGEPDSRAVLAIRIDAFERAERAVPMPVLLPDGTHGTLLDGRIQIPATSPIGLLFLQSLASGE